MKTGLTVLAAAGAVAVVTLVQPTQASAEQWATVIKNFACTISADDWQGEEDLATEEVSHYTQTPSDKAILQCHFDIPEGYEPATAVRTTDFACMTRLGITYDSESIATPGGNVQLRCVVH